MQRQCMRESGRARGTSLISTTTSTQLICLTAAATASSPTASPFAPAQLLTMSSSSLSLSPPAAPVDWPYYLCVRGREGNVHVCMWVCNCYNELQFGTSIIPADVRKTTGERGRKRERERCHITSWVSAACVVVGCALWRSFITRQLRQKLRN